MIYCLNPQCPNPENYDEVKFCLSCGASVQLKERYRAIKLLGEGGFGRTFLAQDSMRLNAPCVIKQFLPLPQVQHNVGLLKKAQEMFTQEARQLLSLGSNRQVPTLFADFEEAGRLYLVQEFIEGDNLLAELHQNGAFSVNKVENVLREILLILQDIHQKNIIHRDIKPENIMRRQDGSLVLIDFGVAKQLTGSMLIKTGTKIGTEGYAPIEQLRGGKAYPASDLYSLAVTCVHLLTGELPDDLYDPMYGRWLWKEALEKQGRMIPDRLQKVLDKMLQEWVSDRYQSAAEAIADLGGSIAAPKSIPQSAIAGKLSQNWKCEHTLTGHDHYAIGVAISPDSQTLVSCSYDKTIKLWHLDNGHLLGTLTGHQRWVSAIAISPNGQILASASLDNTIKLWRLGSGELLREISTPSGYILSLAFSLDGKILAGGSFDSTIQLWDPQRGTRLGFLTGHSGYVESIAFSPDGATLASGGGYDDHTIKLWDIPSMTLKTTFWGHEASVRSVAISPDGTKLISGSEDKTIKIWEIATEKLVYNLANQSSWVQAIAINPNGQIFASGDRNSTIKLWSVYQGKELCSLLWHSGPITSLAFSPDGTRLVSSSWDKTIKIWLS
ncbi:serine/threonine-protein kinase [Planktothricoides raciborskii]|uniref:Serine/threonine protein kinase n=1 Tax=Planktothricoides raciborskii FACHB-1370 TaxID=2949576 RepID=A0ABR8E7Z2_9CYAN|nr:serine/threonine-protein kinase [Planktothricoides raciborskii]MBD2542512.1 serine/threonine protein kinase [Planktothricoides raciborskii FACHB-1370]MBD2580969.1 serine/threonine protein kinase [Planktothricoides raciborskii FACHB-1261]